MVVVGGEDVSNLVFYAQSTVTVIVSGRWVVAVVIGF